MPTVTAADLAAARAEGRAIGSFTTYDLQGTLALRDAAELTGLPVIVSVGAGTFEHVDRATILGVVRAATAGSPSRVGVHLDRSRELDEVAACLELGCSSVTFDGTHLPFEENVERTRAAVALGHRAGAWVEGGPGAGTAADPDRAAEFAERTGVDALAVRAGNGEGGDDGPDLDRLAALADRVRLPLVLRDARGLPDDVLRSAIARGVAKIDVDAGLRRTALAAYAAARPAGDDLQRLLNAAREAVAAVAADRARLFGLPGAR